MNDAERRPPYAALAAGYDFVMSYVDYAAWADYVHDVLDRHAPGAVTSILELGCGTGTLARELQPIGPYRYLATDGAAAMIEAARRIGRAAQDEVAYEVADFTDFAVPAPVDAVLLLYDGLNYLHDGEALGRLFARAHAALRPGGLFLFDLSTPANSLHNEDDFGDEGETDGFRFVRTSRYDAVRRLHTTAFDITTPEGQFHEEHVQRAYTMAEIQPFVDAAGFRTLARYDGFSLDEANDETERVHWVAERG